MLRFWKAGFILKSILKKSDDEALFHYHNKSYFHFKIRNTLVQVSFLRVLNDRDRIDSCPLPP